jgi:hypothetical protein
LFFTRPSIAHYTTTREELVESAKKSLWFNFIWKI